MQIFILQTAMIDKKHAYLSAQHVNNIKLVSIMLPSLNCIVIKGYSLHDTLLVKTGFKQ